MPIKAIALDVDGVLTDGGFWLGSEGQEWKRFSFADIMGLSLARKVGIRLALISGEDSAIVDQLAGKLGITDVYKNCKNKAAALRSFAKLHSFQLSDVCFMGDDVNDVAALEISGFPVAPANACPVVMTKCRLVTKASGGNGAVRELIEHLLADAAAKAGQ